MEIWKPVSEYENHYEVSSYGRIRSLNKTVNSAIRHNTQVVRKGKLLKLNPKRGYLAVDLSVENKKRTMSVHRIVGRAFIPNPDKHPVINHMNGNKQDNRVTNLEWTTYSENSKHRFAVLGHTSPIRRKILCKENGMIFESSTQAAEWLNSTKYAYSKQVSGMGRNIRACCTGRKKSAFGYSWIDLVSTESSTTSP